MFGAKMRTAANPHDDPDGDGFDNLTEFAFGTDPTDPRSWPLKPGLISDGPQRYLSVSFRRRAGAMLDYLVEASSDLQRWSSVAADVVVVVPPRNLFDGTGTMQTTCRLALPLADQRQGFLRVRALARQP